MAKIFNNEGRITEEKFNEVHEMSEDGLTNIKIAKYTGWSEAAISNWLKYKGPTGWKDYCAYKETLRNKNKKVGKTVSPVKVNPDIAEFVQAIANQNEVLQRIARGVEALAEEWKSSPAKKEEVDTITNGMYPVTADPIHG